MWEEETWTERRLREPEERFGIFFTSGTTGKPKGVPLTRQQMISATLGAHSATRPEIGEAWLHALPIHHIGGYSLVLRSLLYGSAVYPMPDGFDTNTFGQLLSEDERITVTSLVPTQLRRLLDDEEFEVHEQFKSILLGGAATSETLIREAVEREIPVTVSYGMTETCAQIAAHPFLDRFDLEDPLDTVGYIFDDNKASIRIDLSDPASQDGNGQIWLRGPQVFTGYLDPADTKQAFDEEGWFNTGDLGQMDHEGRLYVASRRSDMIVTGGENVRPQRVEEAIRNEISTVMETVVLGQEDEEWGHRVVALCVWDEESQELPFGIDELRYRLGEVLEKFELPRAVAYLTELPKTESGKIKRFTLLEQIEAGEITLDSYQ
jgi:O-succinylbenzoic acid--CoA ligase